MGQYKYTLSESLLIELPFTLNHFANDWVTIIGNKLAIENHYSWNGANNVPDFKSTYEATCVHDALYQFKILPRHLADFIFYDILKQKKSKVAKLYYIGVVLFGEYYYNKN